MPAQAYKTYQIAAPKSTHFRKATCAEINCPNYLNGWKVHLEGLPVELRDVIRKTGRKYQVLNVAEGQTYLVFEAGQPCFDESKHMTRLEKPEIYVVRDGDWRGNPKRTEARKHKTAAFWVEDFQEHQDKIKTQIERG
jgi:hypothetical protein